MDFSLALLGLTTYVFIWEKLPHWGNWFNWIIERLPKPLAYLYEAWRCPYCFGFWIALGLHAITGMTTLSALAEAPEQMGSVGVVLYWFLDALATAMLIMFGQLVVTAVSGPAITGFKMKQEFIQGMTEKK